MGWRTSLGFVLTHAAASRSQWRSGIHPGVLGGLAGLSLRGFPWGSLPPTAAHSAAARVIPGRQDSVTGCSLTTLFFNFSFKFEGFYSLTEA